MHADDNAPFIGARVRLGGTHVFTDETGTYRFVSPPVLGDQVLLIDGSTNNSPQFEYPSGIAMPVMIAAGQDNRVLTSYIGRVDATRFTTVVPGQAATVTDPDLPNFSLNIQNGQTIIGWDGQPVTKINVRRVSPDRLPIITNALGELLVRRVGDHGLQRSWLRGRRYHHRSRPSDSRSGGKERNSSYHGNAGSHFLLRTRRDLCSGDHSSSNAMVGRIRYRQWRAAIDVRDCGMHHCSDCLEKASTARAGC